MAFKPWVRSIYGVLSIPFALKVAAHGRRLYFFSYSERWRTTVKCFIDSLKDCRPLLSKCLWINNVAFCETQGRPCFSSGFLNAGEQNLATVIASMYPFRNSHFLSVVRLRRNLRQSCKLTLHVFHIHTCTNCSLFLPSTTFVARAS